MAIERTKKPKQGVAEVGRGAAARLITGQGTKGGQMYKLPELPEKGDEEVDMLVAAFKANILFDGLPALHLRTMARFAERVTVPAGEVLFSAGAASDWLYVVQSGALGVCLLGHSSGDAPSHVYEPKWGAWPCFGEFSILYNRPAPATVKALVEAVIYKLHRESFYAVHKLVARGAAASQPGGAPGKEVDVAVHTVVPKGPAVEALLTRTAENSRLLGALEPEQRSRVVQAMLRVEWRGGQTVCKQGQVHPVLYIVETGRFEVLVQPQHGTGEPQVIHVYDATGKQVAPVFNEQALVFDKPRGSTVRMQSDSNETTGVLWCIRRDAFVAAIQ